VHLARSGAPAESSHPPPLLALVLAVLLALLLLSLELWLDCVSRAAARRGPGRRASAPVGAGVRARLYVRDGTRGGRRARGKGACDEEKARSINAHDVRDPPEALVRDFNARGPHSCSPPSSTFKHSARRDRSGRVVRELSRGCVRIHDRQASFSLVISCEYERPMTTVRRAKRRLQMASPGTPHPSSGVIEHVRFGVPGISPRMRSQSADVCSLPRTSAEEKHRAIPTTRR